MQRLLIMIEEAGAGSAYHAIPYRIASSRSEAMEMMQNYMQIGPADDGTRPCPEFFVLYREHQGVFLDMEPEPIDPITFCQADSKYSQFLAETGRI